MAYDLLFRKQTRSCWSIEAPRARAVSMIAPGDSAVDRPFAPEPLVATAEEQQVLARLAAVKMMADAGDRGARAKWARFVKKELPATRKRARRGDAAAQRLLTVVEQSGLLAGVTAMVVGSDVAFSSREKQLLLFLASVRDRAKAGDVRARAFAETVRKLKL